MLLAPELPLPREVWAHGYVQWDGAKMSKTAGTAVSLGRGDRAARPRRAPLLPAPRSRLRGRRQLHLGAVRRAVHRRPGRRARQPRVALARDARRSTASGVVPAAAEPTTLDQAGDARWPRYAAAMDALDLRGGAEAAWELVADGQPVHPADRAVGAGQGRGGRRSWTSARRLARACTGWRCWPRPFIPGKAQLIWQALGLRVATRLGAAWADARRTRRWRGW